MSGPKRDGTTGIPSQRRAEALAASGALRCRETRFQRNPRLRLRFQHGLGCHQLIFEQGDPGAQIRDVICVPGLCRTGLAEKQIMPP